MVACDSMFNSTIMCSKSIRQTQLCSNIKTKHVSSSHIMLLIIMWLQIMF
jgi:hypothetical protein